MPRLNQNFCKPSLSDVHQAKQAREIMNCFLKKSKLNKLNMKTNFIHLFILFDSDHKDP